MNGKLADLLLASGSVPADVREHLAECAGCRTELAQLEAAMKLLDQWQAPEPTAFFDAKLYARLRAEQATPPANFFERLKARLLYGNSFPMRQLAAGALAAVIALGGGTFALLDHGHAAPPQTSATVRDLQSFDGNAQLFQQLNALDADEGVSSDTSN